MALGSSFFPPRMRLGVVLRNPLAFGVKKTEAVLGIGMALGSGFFKPGACLRVVLRDALTFGVKDTEVILCSGIACFSEGSPFFQRGDVVLPFVSLYGGGHQGFFFAVAQGMGGVCGEEEG